MDNSFERTFFALSYRLQSWWTRLVVGEMIKRFLQISQENLVFYKKRYLYFIFLCQNDRHIWLLKRKKFHATGKYFHSSNTSTGGWQGMWKSGIIPDFAVGFVARRRKPQRNTQLERFCDAGIIIIMLRNKIVSQTTTRATGSFVSSGG